MLPLLVITMPISHGRGRSHRGAATANTSSDCTALEPPKHHNPDPNDDWWLENHPSDDNPYTQSPKQSQTKILFAHHHKPTRSEGNPNLYKIRLGKPDKETRWKTAKKLKQNPNSTHLTLLIPSNATSYQIWESPTRGQTRSDPHAIGWNPNAELNNTRRTRKSKGRNSQKRDEGGWKSRGKGRGGGKRRRATAPLPHPNGKP